MRSAARALAICPARPGQRPLGAVGREGGWRCRSLLVICSMLALAALSGCSRHPGRGSRGAVTQGPAILLRGLGSEPDSLDPQKARADEAQRVLRDICEGLTTLDRSGGVAPGIAQSWQVSPDGKTYTFSLRHD